jgi:hypothetical protein
VRGAGISRRRGCRLAALVLTVDEVLAATRPILSRRPSLRAPAISQERHQGAIRRDVLSEGQEDTVHDGESTDTTGLSLGLTVSSCFPTAATVSGTHEILVASGHAETNDSLKGDTDGQGVSRSHPVRKGGSGWFGRTISGLGGAFGTNQRHSPQQSTRHIELTGNVCQLDLRARSHASDSPG